MLYKLSEIGGQKCDALLNNFLIANDVEEHAEDYLYSFKDVETICFIITANLIHLFSSELHHYI